MVKDLILFNPDRDNFTLKQLSSIMREMVSIQHDTKLDAVLSYFEKGTTHVAMITKVETPADSDPYLRKIGLITLEDIIEVLIDAEIADEYEA
jgi:metal transporter CNNM